MFRYFDAIFPCEADSAPIMKNTNINNSSKKPTTKDAAYRLQDGGTVVLHGPWHEPSPQVVRYVSTLALC